MEERGYTSQTLAVVLFPSSVSVQRDGFIPCLPPLSPPTWGRSISRLLLTDDSSTLSARRVYSRSTVSTLPAPCSRSPLQPCQLDLLPVRSLLMALAALLTCSRKMRVNLL